MTNLRIAEYKGVESTDNSTTVSLGVGGVFTGEWEEIIDYASIRINIYSDQDAAEMGLDFQQSPDQTIIFDEPYGYDAGTHKLYNINPNAKYFRIVFTNGTVAQTTFSLQTIYGSVFVRPTSHRLSDTLSGNDDTDVVKSAISFLNEVDDEYKNVGIQNPFPVDGDAVYAKDIWVLQSDMGDFSGSVTDLFDNLHSVVVDSTSNNPKELFIHFNRSIISNVVGLGSFSGNFSNTEIEIYNSGAVATTVIDESADATKYTSRTFQLPTTVGFNAIKFIFHTADTVTLSNSVMLKTRSVVARLQATKPDNTVTDINATTGGNLKISLEEIESGISSNANSQLNTTVFNTSGVELPFDTNGLSVKDYLIEVSKGNISGSSIVHKFGKNEAVTSAFTSLSIGGVYETPQPAAATTLRVKIGNVNDDAGGTGARLITVRGLDETGALVEEDLAPNGTASGVAGTTTFMRVFRAWVKESGTYATVGTSSHAASIVIENSAGGTDWATIHYAGTGRSQTQIGQYTVPLGKTAYIFEYLVTTDSNKAVDFLFFKREGILDSAAPYQAKRTIVEEIGIQGNLNGMFLGGIMISQLSDVGWFVKAAASAEATVDFEILLVDN